MSADARVWRGVLVTLCVLGFVVIAAVVAMVPAHGLSGIAYDVPSRPFVRSMTKVFPDSPAAKAGVRPGDLYDFRMLPPDKRYRWIFGRPAGEPIPVTVRRGGQALQLTLTPQSSSAPLRDWRFWMAIGGNAYIVLFALLISLRRPDAVEARLLALFLLSTNFTIQLGPINWITPWIGVDVAANILAPFFLVGALGFVAYTLLFGRPPSPTRRALAVLTGIFVGVGIVENTLGIAGTWAGFMDPDLPPLNSPWYVLIHPVWPALAGAILAIRESSGAERTRLIWAVVPVGTFGVLQAVADLFTALPAGAADIGWIAGSVSLLLMPLGLTYSLLSRRLLDIGFALNRAAVFAVTSLLLAGVFAGLQWAANTVLTDLSRSHNLLVQMAITLTVYYVVRLTRHQTDAVVGRVFFAARRRRIASIRTLRREVDEVSEADDIAPFVVDALRAQTGIEAIVLLPDARGTFEPTAGARAASISLPNDDAMLLALRAEREPVRAPAWAGSAALAFPMLIRGRLRGVLIARTPDGDELAPDESAALLALAREMAGARDDLLAESLREKLGVLEFRSTG